MCLEINPIYGYVSISYSVEKEKKKKPKETGDEGTRASKLREFQKQALQSHVHLKEELGSSLKKVRELKSSNQSLKQENDNLKASNLEAKKTALEASGRAVEATLELNKLKSTIDLLQAKLKAKEADYDALYDKAEDNVLNAVIKTRADLMREYRDGRATEWKVESWIADHEELTRSDDEADAKDAGDAAALPPPEGSAVVALAAQPAGESDGFAP
ncbi:hypothetical protein ACOSP7_027560 [Xanthoceras sorbifolium]